jgi:hypothetical protein
LRKKQAGAKDKTVGKGIGQVGMFDVYEYKLLSLQNGLWKNSSWGITMAPRDFGAFSYRLLIGKLGDGIINR